MFRQMLVIGRINGSYFKDYTEYFKTESEAVAEGDRIAYIYLTEYDDCLTVSQTTEKL